MDKSYWDTFYAANKGVNEPSLFARWVLEQVETDKKIVDMGCGNGRTVSISWKTGCRSMQ